MVTDLRSELQARFREVLEDRPAELRIAVNGLFVGSQAVTGERSEQRIKILIAERIGFIEVFSEYGTCLLYLDVEAPPDGPTEQSASVTLSDDRRLSARLTFSEASPVLDVVYEDRHVAAPAVLLTGQVARERVPASTGARRLFRPFVFSSAVTAALVAVWFWATWGGAQISAAELLRNARVAEAKAAVPGMTSHRLMTVEHQLVRTAKVVARQRLEVWHDTARALNVRRLFDERSQVVAGLWTRSDGTRTVYRPGAPPVVETATPQAERVSVQTIWQHEPSAGDFLAIAGSDDRAAITERTADYVLSYRPAPAPADGVVEVSLTISKADGRATAEVVTFVENGEAHRFSFTETNWEHLPVDTVAPEVFEPEPGLLAEPVTPSLPMAVASLPPVRHAVPLTPPVLSAAEIDKLELDATYRLYRAQIWLEQDARIERRSNGIAVTAVVPAAVPETMLRRSFEELLLNPAVVLQLSVSPDRPAPPSAVPDVAALSQVAAFPMLRQFFGNRDDPALDEGMRGFVNSMLEGCARREARLQALTTLIHQWPDERLRGLSLESVVTWQLMVVEHADAIRRETQLLSAQVPPVFRLVPLVSAARPQATAPMASVKDAEAAANRMAELGAVQAAALRSAFMPCASAPCDLPDLDRLLQSFAETVAEASRFTRFYLRVGGDR